MDALPEWKDLPKRYGLFTKRSTTMVNIVTGAVVAHYRSNTKINVVQETTFNEVRYFRTESAMMDCLDLAIKADSFNLPSDLASLAPFEVSLKHTLPKQNLPNVVDGTQKSPEPQKPLKSEGGVSEDRKQNILSAFSRFFKRSK